MIPILLDKTKSLSTLITDKTAGVGEISGAFDGIAIEEANGIKELSFKLPINSPRYSQIQTGSYIKAKVDNIHDPQIYEIYRITKPINGIVTIYAQHISYILGKATVSPFTATGITLVCAAMISNLIGTFPFTFESDIQNATSVFSVDVPMSFRKAIGGWRGSILDIFGGELDWDNNKVKLLAHRGQDRGVIIEYGKNLTSLTQEESIANVYDAVLGFAIINEETHIGDIQKITTTNSPRTLNIDFSNEFEFGIEYTDEEIKTRLNALALSYAQNNNIGIPKINLKVSFEPLSKFEEYKDTALFEQTNLFDTVHVLFSKLGVQADAKIIRTEYDFINEKMKTVELGDAKTNLLGLVDEQIESQIADTDIEVDVGEIEEAIGFLDSYVENLSDIISNSLGLFFTKVQKQSGGYQYFLHNEPVLANSQYQWTINQGGFALSTDYGQTWVAGIDAQGDAVLNSLSTVTLRALNIYGSYIQGSQIVFGDPSSQNAKYIVAQVYNNGTDDIGVTFDGTGYVRFRPQQQFVIDNIDSNSQLYNRFRISGGSTYYMEMINYKRSANEIANELKLNSSSTLESITVANHNHNLNGIANRIFMSSDTSNVIRFSNNKIASADNSNEIALSSGSTSETIEILNGKWKSGSYTYNSNYISLQRNQTDSMIYVRNRYPNTNSDANHLLMFYQSGYSSVELANLDSNGSFMNYLQFNKNNDNTARLYAKSDLRLISDGAVRVSSAGGQDIVLDSNDDLHLNYGDKLYINGKTISLDSSGYVKWSS